MSCSTGIIKKIDIQGHRGCRGLMPENSIPGFIKAVEIGVNTLEMDVVISMDKKVLLSHEPFLSHKICLNSDEQEIHKKDETNYNLFQMTYEEIKKCDCGTKPHSRFPSQKKLPIYKPLLSEVIDTIEQYINSNSLPPVQYNIETKCTPDGDGIFHPLPSEFVDLLFDVIKEKDILHRTIIQSFDLRILQIVKGKYPDMTLSLLIDNNYSPDGNITKLGFIPDIYSPQYLLVDNGLLEYAEKNKMKVIPWTVNEQELMKLLIELGVDGIITDYPDRMMEVVRGLQE
ncbi:MAG: glycerophosphodiester phosphodiesterase family protein [Bacteroidota bacterium]